MVSVKKVQDWIFNGLSWLSMMIFGTILLMIVIALFFAYTIVMWSIVAGIVGVFVLWAIITIAIDTHKDNLKAEAEARQFCEELGGEDGLRSAVMSKCKEREPRYVGGVVTEERWIDRTNLISGIKARLRANPSSRYWQHLAAYHKIMEGTNPTLVQLYDEYVRQRPPPSFIPGD